MTRYRALLSVVLAAIATFVIGCGGPNAATVPVYTPDKVAQIQIYAPGVENLRAQFPELEGYIQRKDWVNIRSFIHGPMGELRVRLGRLAAQLLPQDAAPAKALTEEIGVHLEKLDAATADYNQVEAGKQYRLALDDFDSFLNLVPTAPAG
ncbi:MAG: photosystem II protein PsbQ [Leptolyngbya sp.]|nr:photosystem II protein PsbQ [Leptolyngbya sp.]